MNSSGRIPLIVAGLAGLTLLISAAFFAGQSSTPVTNVGTTIVGEGGAPEDPDSTPTLSPSPSPSSAMMNPNEPIITLRGRITAVRDRYITIDASDSDMTTVGSNRYNILTTDRTTYFDANSKEVERDTVHVNQQVRIIVTPTDGAFEAIEVRRIATVTPSPSPRQ